MNVQEFYKMKTEPVFELWYKCFNSSHCKYSNSWKKQVELILKLPHNVYLFVKKSLMFY